MRKPTRTPKCWYLPTLLHPHQLPTTTSHNLTPTHTNRHPPPNNIRINPSHPYQLMGSCSIRPRPTISIHSKSTSIWTSPMTAQSTCRSSNCRINTTRCLTLKTRRIRHHTNHPPTRPPLKPSTLPIPYPSLMRSINNKLNLPTSNRPKVPHRLLFCKSYRSSHRC